MFYLPVWELSHSIDRVTQSSHSFHFLLKLIDEKFIDRSFSRAWIVSSMFCDLPDLIIWYMIWSTDWAKVGTIEDEITQSNESETMLRWEFRFVQKNDAHKHHTQSLAQTWDITDDLWTSEWNFFLPHGKQLRYVFIIVDIFWGPLMADPWIWWPQNLILSN